jgi:hypothetical protein
VHIHISTGTHHGSAIHAFHHPAHAPAARHAGLASGNSASLQTAYLSHPLATELPVFFSGTLIG